MVHSGLVSPFSTPPARRALRASGLALALAAGAAGAACTGVSPQQDVSTAQVVVDLTDAVNELRQENAVLQGQIDSLRIEVARQDTLVRQMAGAMGVLPR